MKYDEQELLIRSITEIFCDNKYNNERNKFELVKNPLHPNPLIHALMILSKYQEDSKQSPIMSAEHDIIYLAQVQSTQITEEELLDLLRCGLRFETEFECFYIYT